MIQNISQTLPDINAYVFGAVVAFGLAATFGSLLLDPPKGKWFYSALMVLAPLAVAFRYYVELRWSV